MYGCLDVWLGLSPGLGLSLGLGLDVWIWVRVWVWVWAWAQDPENHLRASLRRLQQPTRKYTPCLYAFCILSPAATAQQAPPAATANRRVATGCNSQP